MTLAFNINGEHLLGASLELANGTMVVGVGPLGSRLVSTSLAPVVANAEAVDAIGLTLKQICLEGGTCGLDLNIGGVATDIHIEDVIFLNSSEAGLRCNKMLIISSFRRVTFDSTNKGLVNDAANANLVSLDACQFKELGDTAIELLGGGEVLSVNATRFEARNLPGSDTGKPVIKLQAFKCAMFSSSYFEDTFKQILLETGSTGTTAFVNNRFSGQENTGGGLQSEIFSSDGIVTFFNNQFDQTSEGAENMLLLGCNPGLKTHNSNVYYQSDDSRICVRSKVIQVGAAGIEDLFEFTRSDVSGFPSNQQTLCGTVRFCVQGKTADATPVHMTLIQPITISGFAGACMSITLGAPQTAYDNAPGAALSMGQKDGATSSAVTLAGSFALANFGSAQMTALLDVVPVRLSEDWPHIIVVPA